MNDNVFQPSRARARDRRASAVRGFLRFLIGAVLLATATGKLLDLRGFAEVLRAYRAFADWALFPLAFTISLAEVLLAGWLFTGRKLFEAALCSVAMHLLYAGWSAASILRGLKLANCGCFGVFFKRPLGWSTVVEDLIMTGISAALVVLARRA